MLMLLFLHIIECLFLFCVQHTRSCTNHLIFCNSQDVRISSTFCHDLAYWEYGCVPSLYVLPFFFPACLDWSYCAFRSSKADIPICFGRFRLMNIELGLDMWVYCTAMRLVHSLNQQNRRRQWFDGWYLRDCCNFDLICILQGRGRAASTNVNLWNEENLHSQIKSKGSME